MSEVYNPRLFIKNATAWTAGSGSPEGVVIGDVGDFYTDSDVSIPVTVYEKTSGTGTNTGWVVK